MADLVEPFDPERYNARPRSPRTCSSACRPPRRSPEGGSPSTPASAMRSIREPDGRPRRHGRPDRRDHDGDLPRPSARPSALRAVLLHRRRGTRRVRGHRPAPRQAAARLPPHDPTRLLALPLALYRAAPPPRPYRRSIGDRLVAARPPCTSGCGASRAGGRVLRCREVSTAAPLRDNLLFGRVNHNAANAQARSPRRSPAWWTSSACATTSSGSGSTTRSARPDACCPRRSGRSSTSCVAS